MAINTCSVFSVHVSLSYKDYFLEVVKLSIVYA